MKPVSAALFFDRLTSLYCRPGHHFFGCAFFICSIVTDLKLSKPSEISTMHTHTVHPYTYRNNYRNYIHAGRSLNTACRRIIEQQAAAWYAACHHSRRRCQACLCRLCR